jgi:AhpD family alkylhydroperoxidase
MGMMEARVEEFSINLEKIESLSPDQLGAWKSFLTSAGMEGALSPRRKELIAVALSVGSRCDWCIARHVKSALELGARKQEIIEAGWLAVLMGGDPAMMYMQRIYQALDEFQEIGDEEEVLRAQTQLAVDSEYKKLYEHLLDYVKCICNEAEVMCEGNADRKRLALNIAETDGNVLNLLVQKECQKRGWMESAN